MPKAKYSFQTNATCVNCTSLIENAIRNEIHDRYGKSNTEITITVNILVSPACVDVEVKINPENPLSDTEVFKSLLMETMVNIGKDFNKDSHTHKLLKGLIGISAGLFLIVFSLLNITFPFMPLIMVTLSVALTAYLGYDTFKDEFQRIIKARNWSSKLSFGKNTLFTLGAIVTVSTSMLSLVVRGVSMACNASLLTFGFKELGEYIEQKFKRKISQNLTFSKSLGVPEKVRLVPTNGTSIDPQTTPSYLRENLKKDQEILVIAGEIIPVDGVVIAFNKDSHVQKEAENGDKDPVKPVKEEILLAGTQVLTGSVQIQITGSSHIVEQDTKLKEILADKAKSVTVADTILKYFVVVVLLLALATFILLNLSFPFGVALGAGLFVLVMACPCILGSIIPFLVSVFIVKLRKKGVEADGKGLHKAAQNITAVAFDFTGTLTEGKPKVTSLDFDEELFKKEEILRFLYTLEKENSHPFAKGIREYVTQDNDGKEPDLLHAEISSTYSPGVQAKMDGNMYALGNLTLMQSCGVTNLPSDLSNKSSENTTIQTLYLAKNNQIIAQLTLEDRIRKEAIPVIKELIGKGILVHVITGAKQAAVEPFIAELNKQNIDIPIDTDCNPQDKFNIIKDLQQKTHKVAMVGDGVNDTLAITQSDCGICMLHEKNINSNYSDLVIRNNSLLSLFTIFSVAKQTHRHIVRNLIITLCYNPIMFFIMLGFLILLGIALPPFIGPLAMIFEMIVVYSLIIAFIYEKTPDFEYLLEKDAKPGDSSQFILGSLVDPNSPKVTVASKVSPDDTFEQDSSIIYTPYPNLTEETFPLPHQEEGSTRFMC